MSVFVPLAMDPFVAFGQGCKTVEIRAAKSPVAAQVRKHKAGDPVRLRWGYGPHGLHGIREWQATLGRVWEAPRLMDLPKEALDGAALSGELGRYFDPEQPVLAFEAFRVEAEPDCPTCTEAYGQPMKCQGCGPQGPVLAGRQTREGVEGMSDKLTESEFRLIAMGFGATLAEVDADCRERCSRLGQACWADQKPRIEGRSG